MASRIPAPPKSRLPGTEGKSITRLEDWAADADARLATIESAPAAPAVHATTHEAGGSDPIPLDALAAPSDVTTLNATTGAHGLLPKLPGDATEFLAGDGTFATPPGDSGTFPNSISGTTDVPANRHVMVPGRTVIAAGGKLRIKGDAKHRATQPREIGMWCPDAPPNYPHPLNDEFNGSTLGPQWKTDSGGGTLTTALTNSHLRFTMSSGSGVMGFAYLPVPDGEWSAWTKVSPGGGVNPTANATFNGLVVGSDLGKTNTPRKAVNVFVKASDFMAVRMESWTGNTTISGTNGLQTRIGGGGCYLRISYSPTTGFLYTHFSTNGIGWWYVYGLNIPSEGWAPAHVGMFMLNQSGDATPQVSFFDFLRFETGITASEPVQTPPRGAMI